MSHGTAHDWRAIQDGSPHHATREFPDALQLTQDPRDPKRSRQSYILEAGPSSGLGLSVGQYPHPTRPHPLAHSSGPVPSWPSDPYPTPPSLPTPPPPVTPYRPTRTGPILPSLASMINGSPRNPEGPTFREPPHPHSSSERSWPYAAAPDPAPHWPHDRRHLDGPYSPAKAGPPGSALPPPQFGPPRGLATFQSPH